VSHLFQRPLCEMGKAYDYAYRPLLGDPEPEGGGPCDDRPHAVELCSAQADPGSSSPGWRAFQLCPEHETQLRQQDRRLTGASRFRPSSPVGGPSSPGGRARR
jgi:hypothetical protein